MQEPTENEAIEETHRATELQHGTVSVEMTNAIAKMTIKPNARDNLGNIISNPWTVADFASQPQLIGNFDSSSLPWVFENTWVNVRNLFPKVLNNFKFWSWTLNFRFEINSIFQEQGMDVIYISNVPNSLYSFYLGKNGISDQNTHQTLPTATWWQLPHRKITLGENSDHHVALKWNSPFKMGFQQDEFRTQGTNDYFMNAVVYRNFIPIEVAQGVTIARTVRIWAYLTDLEYSAYEPSDVNNF